MTFRKRVWFHCIKDKETHWIEKEWIGIKILQCRFLSYWIFNPLWVNNCFDARSIVVESFSVFRDHNDFVSRGTEFSGHVNCCHTQSTLQLFWQSHFLCIVKTLKSYFKTILFWLLLNLLGLCCLLFGVCIFSACW